MIVDSIENGIVIDHIKAGIGMKILNHIEKNLNEDTVAIIMNANSKKIGKKDIIKIENLIDVDLAALGLLDHNATVNIIKEGKLEKKVKLNLPEKIKNVIKCKNPRCVTSTEPSIPHIFILTNAGKKEYRCYYCDEMRKV